MIVIYSCSKEYLKYFNISVASVLKYNPDAKIVVICKERLDIPYEQITVEQTKWIKGKTISSSWEGNAKAFITQLPYDKIIYLGADTICQGSLQEMWDEPCKYINACRTHAQGAQQAEQLGIEFYINVDSMVMNLKAMREDGFTQQIIDNVDNLFETTTPWFNEETIINKIFHDKIKLLPQKYNYAHNRNYDEPMEYSDATILHFIGADKSEMLKFS